MGLCVSGKRVAVGLEEGPADPLKVPDASISKFPSSQPGLSSANLSGSDSGASNAFPGPEESKLAPVTVSDKERADVRQRIALMSPSSFLSDPSAVRTTTTDAAFSLSRVGPRRRRSSDDSMIDASGLLDLADDPLQAEPDGGLPGEVNNKVMAERVVSDMNSAEARYKDWEQLRSLKVFLDRADVDEQSQERFLHSFVLRTYNPGEYIVTQGATGEEFFVITDGRVSVFKNDAPARAFQLYEGHFFGEVSLLRQQPRNANVRAESHVSCMVMDKATFTDFVNQDGKFKTAVNAIIEEQQRIREVREQRSAAGPVPDIKASASYYSPVKQSRLVQSRIDTYSGFSRRGELINEYAVLRVLGNGSFGIVKLAQSVVSGNLVALKVVDRTSLGRKIFGKNVENLLQREVAIMKKLNHPNVVKLIEVIRDPVSTRLYLVQEFVENGPLMDEKEYNQPLSPPLAREYFRGICEGLHYLHSQAIVHRDIKPSNVLVSSNGTCKLADFGVSSLGLDDASGHAGTPAFMPPEAFDDGPYSGVCADIWALGALLYNLVVGVPPFMANTQLELERKIKNDKLRFPEQIYNNPHLRHLLGRMLDKNPSTRASLAEIMANEWVTEEGSRPLVVAPYAAIEISDAELKSALDDREPIAPDVRLSVSNGPHSFSVAPFLLRRWSYSDLTAFPVPKEPWSQEQLQLLQRPGVHVGRLGRPLSESLPSTITTRRHSLWARSLRSLDVYESRDLRFVQLENGVVLPLSSLGNPIVNRAMGPTVSQLSMRTASTDHSLRTKSRQRLSGVAAGNPEAHLKNHLAQLRRRQATLLEGHSALTPEMRDVLLEQRRVALSACRAQAIVADLFNSSTDNLPHEEDKSDEPRQNAPLTRKADFVAVPLPATTSADGNVKRQAIIFHATGSGRLSVAHTTGTHPRGSRSRTASLASEYKDYGSPGGSTFSPELARAATSVSELSDDTDGEADVAMDLDFGGEGVPSRRPSARTQRTDSNSGPVSMPLLPPRHNREESTYSEVMGGVDETETQEAMEELDEVVNEDDDDADDDLSDVEQVDNELDPFFDSLCMPAERLDQDPRLLPLDDAQLAEWDTARCDLKFEPGCANPLLRVVFGMADTQGTRSNMEDRIKCVASLDGTAGLGGWFGVYDGHNGPEVASMLQDKLHTAVVSSSHWPMDPARALFNGFRLTDEQVCAECLSTKKFAGATANVLCVLKTSPEAQASMLFCANVGDCRCVLSRGGRAVELSKDHKTSAPTELARVKAAGGFIHNGRLDGRLAVTRSFGDVEHKALKRAGAAAAAAAEPETIASALIADPDIMSQALVMDDEFCIIACDGLWDVITSQQAVEFVRRSLLATGNVQATARELVECAVTTLKSVDNVSAVIVVFHQLFLGMQ